MEKKYQIFVSSTFRDLVDERQDIIRAILDLGHIPAGMEIFPASDQAQFDYIRKVIDECDYYILVVGGRYGALGSDGVSFTEKEYDYAVERGLPVLSFVHGAPADISVGRSDIEPALMARLDAFRAKVCEGRLVKFWTSRETLQAAVVISLVKAMSEQPAVGWMRASVAANQDILEQINNLRIENNELSEKNRQLVAASKPIVENLAGFEDLFSCRYKYTVYSSRGGSAQAGVVSLPWKEIFLAVAPSLVSAQSPVAIEKALETFLKEVKQLPANLDVFSSDSNTIKIQLCALGLIRMYSADTVAGGVSEFVELTPNGRAKMLELGSITR